MIELPRVDFVVHVFVCILTTQVYLDWIGTLTLCGIMASRGSLKSPSHNQTSYQLTTFAYFWSVVYPSLSHHNSNFMKKNSSYRSDGSIESPVIHQLATNSFSSSERSCSNWLKIGRDWAYSARIIFSIA